MIGYVLKINKNVKKIPIFLSLDACFPCTSIEKLEEFMALGWLAGFCDALYENKRVDPAQRTDAPYSSLPPLKTLSSPLEASPASISKPSSITSPLHNTHVFDSISPLRKATFGTMTSFI
ncbi:MAG: hypothetical protein ABIL68_03645 [bacterium]